MTAEEMRLVPIEDIVEGLVTCICCDEPDSGPFRSEVRYWLNELVRWNESRHRV